MNFIHNSSSSIFLGVEKNPKNEKAWSSDHPLALNITNLISMFVRKLGGFSFQELNLPIDDIKRMSKLGPDFTYDFVMRSAYIHAIIAKDADFLRLKLDLLKESGMSVMRLIHALQNHDEINYHLVEFDYNQTKQYSYQNRDYSGKDILDTIRQKDFKTVLNKKIPYIKLFGNGPATTMVGICAAALGVEDIFSMTAKQEEEVKKAHILLAYFNAMQPGAFNISGWDLVGAYPLKFDEVKELIKDGDTRWLNRGAFDLLEIGRAHV